MINVYTLTYVYIYRKKEREGEENFRLNLESRFINANLSINRLDGQWFGVKQAAIKKGELKKRKRKKEVERDGGGPLCRRARRYSREFSRNIESATSRVCTPILNTATSLPLYPCWQDLAKRVLRPWRERRLAVSRSVAEAGSLLSDNRDHLFDRFLSNQSLSWLDNRVG